GHTAPHIGDHVHDCAATGLHALRVHLTGNQEAAGEVGGQDGLPPLLADGLERHRVLAAGVVHQAVDDAVLGQHVRHRRTNQFLVANVEDVVRGGAAVSANLGDRPFELLGVAARDEDVGTEAGELVGRASADAGPAASDDDGATVENAVPEDR